MKRFFLKVVLIDGTVLRTRILANQITDFLLGSSFQGVSLGDFSNVRCFSIEEVY